MRRALPLPLCEGEPALSIAGGLEGELLLRPLVSAGGSPSAPRPSPSWRDGTVEDRARDAIGGKSNGASSSSSSKSSDDSSLSSVAMRAASAAAAAFAASAADDSDCVPVAVVVELLPVLVPTGAES